MCILYGILTCYFFQDLALLAFFLELYLSLNSGCNYAINI